MEFSAIITLKLATYRELLFISPDIILPHDIKLMALLSNDPDIQGYIEEQRNGG